MAGGWRNEFQLSDAWSLVADVSYSKADARPVPARDQRAVLGLRESSRCFDTGTFELRGNDHMPSLTFRRRLRRSGAGRWSARRSTAPGYTKKPHIEDELTSFRLDAIARGRHGLVRQRLVRRQLQRPHEGQVIAGSRTEHDRRRRLPDRATSSCCADEPQLRGCRARRWRSNVNGVLDAVLQPDRLWHTGRSRASRTWPASSGRSTKRSRPATCAAT